jgi:hypothetical protein
VAESEEPTQAEIEDEESGADDPELQELDKLEPEDVEPDDDPEDASNEEDEIEDEELLPEENYDPANDGDDSILAEVVKEEADG